MFEIIDCIPRVRDHSGISLLYNVLEIYHSGPEPSICKLPRGECVNGCQFLGWDWARLRVIVSLHLSSTT